MCLPRWTFIPAIFALVLLGACSPDPTTPTEPLSGVYLLQQANGAPLPFVLSSGTHERYELLAESLTFLAEGEVVRERTFRLTKLGTGRDTTYTHAIRQAYLLHGERLEIGSFRPCPPDANCVGNDVGVASDQRIELQSALYSTGPELPRFVYVRR